MTTTTAPVCSPHHWRLPATGEGGIVTGTCLHCGAEQRRDNVFVGDRDPMSAKKAAAGDYQRRRTAGKDKREPWL